MTHWRSISKHIAHAAGRPISSIALSVFIACGYFSIRPHDDAARSGKEDFNSAVVMGEVEASTDRPVMVSAFRSGGGTVPTETVTLERPGPFMLYLPAGRYRIAASCDFDLSGSFDDSEICAANESEIALGEGEVKQGVVVSAAGARGGFPHLKMKDDPSVSRQPAPGERVKIYDERFCRHNAEIGWWSPSRFMRAFGARIWFIRAYDPAKIPVLFVHGAQGSPHDFACFYFRLDSGRYQQWYYYYPTGIRIVLASRLLYENLRELRRRFNFSVLCITAHSMGGLVARDMITKWDLRGIGIDRVLYVAIASPWSGFRSADRAASLPTKRLPVWIDVGASSDFISQLLRRPIPPGVSYYLFYGRDDAVAAERALDERAREGALGIYAYNQDHEGILCDRQVYDTFAAILRKEMP